MSTRRAGRQDNASRTVGDVPDSGHAPGVTVVIPCLNECSTIAEAVVQAKGAFANWPGGVEVVVADNFGSKLTDCNSGFRAFRRERLTAWPSPLLAWSSPQSSSSMRCGLAPRSSKCPLRCARRERQPHLQTWRDGMRHLLTILARAPGLFLHSGLAIVVLSVLLATLCAFGPRVVLGRFAVFDYHSLMFAVLLGFVGAQVFGTGLLLQLRGPRPLTGLAPKLLDLHEGVLFWLLAGMTAGVVGGGGFVAWSWAQHGFANIAYLKFTLFLLYIATVLGSFGMSLFYAHLLKRA